MHDIVYTLTLGLSSEHLRFCHCEALPLQFCLTMCLSLFSSGRQSHSTAFLHSLYPPQTWKKGYHLADSLFQHINAELVRQCTAPAKQTFSFTLVFFLCVHVHQKPDKLHTICIHSLFRAKVRWFSRSLPKQKLRLWRILIFPADWMTGFLKSHPENTDSDTTAAAHWWRTMW